MLPPYAVAGGDRCRFTLDRFIPRYKELQLFRASENYGRPSVSLCRLHDQPDYKQRRLLRDPVAMRAWGLRDPVGYTVPGRRTSNVAGAVTGVAGAVAHREELPLLGEQLPFGTRDGDRGGLFE